MDYMQFRKLKGKEMHAKYLDTKVKLLVIMAAYPHVVVSIDFDIDKNLLQLLIAKSTGVWVSLNKYT
jgi:hypothetical protein